MKLPEKKVYIAQTGSGRIEIPLTGEEINSICTMGSNDAAVESVCNKPRLRCWMMRYSKELIREEIRSYSDWTEEELSSDEDNLQRLVWLLAWNVSDSDDPDSFLADEDYEYNNDSEVIHSGLHQPEEDEARLTALRAALQEGIDSGICENFDPAEYLKQLKAFYHNS